MNWKLVKAALVLFGIGGGVGLAGMLVGTGLAEIITMMLEVLR